MGFKLATTAWIELEFGQTGVILQITTNIVIRTLEKRSVYTLWEQVLSRQDRVVI